MPLSSAHRALDTFVATVGTERRFVRRGRSYPSDDPLVVAHPHLFKLIHSFHPEPDGEVVEKPKRTYRKKR